MDAANSSRRAFAPDVVTTAMTVLTPALIRVGWPGLSGGGGNVAGPVAITELLNAAAAGDNVARDAAYTLVYEELKLCARAQNKRAQASSLTATALVSELYLKLQSGRLNRIHSRRHFFALAARAMRQIMVDHARNRARAKRGDGAEHIAFDTREVGGTSADEALELDAALDDLTRCDPNLAQLVEWHFFAGLSFEQIAAELACSERTVRREWSLARAFLRKAMHHGKAE
jgi:RNA polymerase sigma factor (TIGR02999 family)